MLINIITHTPVWVFVLLLALIVLGLLQTRTRSIPPARALALPVAMLFLSAYGVLSSFGFQALTMTTWLVTMAALTALTAARVNTGRLARDPSSRRLAVPGSWLPLAMMLAMFAAKYVVGAGVAISPALAGDPGFQFASCAIFGVINGVLIGRVLPLIRIAGQIPGAAIPAR